MLTLLGTHMLRLLWLEMVAEVQFGSNTAGCDNVAIFAPWRQVCDPGLQRRVDIAQADLQQ